MNALNLYKIRQEVRFILRDEAYPKEDIDSAINRVIADINNAGRFRFQQSSVNVALVNGTYRYTFDPTLLGDYVVVWAPFVKDVQKIIEKGSELIDAFTEGYFSESGDAPSHYWIWGTEIFINPIPNATAAARTLTIFCFKDLAELTGDLDKPAIPARYHRNVLAYGAAAQLAPALLVRTATGSISVQQAYQKSFEDLVRQELWEPFKTGRWDLDDRFKDMHSWGHVSTVR